MATKEQLTDKIKKIAAQLSGNIKDDHGILLPPYAIKGSGESYFLSYIDKQFVKIARGTEVYILENNFFSSRRSKKNKNNDYGRNISAIMIK